MNRLMLCVKISCVFSWLLFSKLSTAQFVPINFHHQIYTPKEATLGAFYSSFVGLETNYSLPNNLQVFGTIGFRFIPYKSSVIGFGTEYRNEPNDWNANLGLAYVLQSKNKPANRFSLGVGLGRTQKEGLSYFASDGTLQSKSSSSISSGFGEAIYSLEKRKFIHFVSTRFAQHYFNKYEEHYKASESKFIANGQSTGHLAFGYGLKYKINNFKLGLQLGFYLPTGSLSYSESSPNITTSSSIVDGPGTVFNLNVHYTIKQRIKK